MSNIIDMMREKYNTSPLCYIFVSVILISVVLFVIAIICSDGQILHKSSGPDLHDLFMDHFNSIKYSLNRPYTYYHVIYPPLITVLYMILGHYLAPYVDSDIPESEWAFALRDSYFGMLTYVMLVLIFVYLSYKLLGKLLKKHNSTYNENLILCLLISFPFTYAIVRGNCIILAFVLLLVFLLTFDSKDKKTRYIGYLFLCLSTGIKIFPAIFTLLVLREKRYKETVFCIIGELLFLLVPFIFTDGSISVLIDTALNYTSTVFTNEILNIQTLIIAITPAEFHGTIGYKILSYGLILIVYLLAAIVVLFDKKVEMWRLLTIIGAALALGLGTPAPYNNIYLLAPILLFFSRPREITKTNIFVTICFIIMVAVIVCDGFIITFEYMTSIRCIAVFLLFIVLITQELTIMIHKDNVVIENV